MTKDRGCLPRAGHGLELQGRIPRDVSSWPDISIPRKRVQIREEQARFLLPSGAFGSAPSLERIWGNRSSSS